MTVAAAKKVALNTRLDTASCRLPLIPWPLVQPPASLAPKIINATAKNAATNRTGTLPPNRPRHNAGTASLLRSPES